LLRYLTQRLRYSILVLLGVVTVVFFLFNIMPADPARLTMGQRSDLASVENARKEMNLDKPIWKRYLLYLNDLSPVGIHAHADRQKYHSIPLVTLSENQELAVKWPYLGRSYRTKREVNIVLAEALPGTIILAIAAMLIATIGGICWVS
jgi:peptide/nickel transport system permease protein